MLSNTLKTIVLKLMLEIAVPRVFAYAYLLHIIVM